MQRCLQHFFTLCRELLIYQGEEIGMVNADYSIDEFDDIEMLNAYQDLVVDRKMMDAETFMDAAHKIGRDNARTPMQWDSSENAGFSDVKPWMKVNPRYKEINVEDALKDENSIFYYYKKLIEFRHNDDVITNAGFELIDRENEAVFAYERKFEEKSIIVIANFYEDEVEFKLDDKYSMDDYNEYISNYNTHSIEGNTIKLKPFESIVIKNY